MRLRSVMGRPYDIQDRAFLFATEVVDFCRPVLPPREILRELAKQLLKSGSSIGANLEEADAGQSKPDFRSKVSISRKEAFETRYWLRLMVHADSALEKTAAPLLDEARQLSAILDDDQEELGTKRQPRMSLRSRHQPVFGIDPHSAFPIRH